MLILLKVNTTLTLLWSLCWRHFIESRAVGCALGLEIYKLRVFKFQFQQLNPAHQNGNPAFQLQEEVKSKHYKFLPETHYFFFHDWEHHVSKFQANLHDKFRGFNSTTDFNKTWNGTISLDSRNPGGHKLASGPKLRIPSSVSGMPIAWREQPCGVTVRENASM